MKDKKVNYLSDEHFITRDEIRELILSVEKVELGIESLNRSNCELKEDIVTIRDVIMNKLVDDLTFRMFIIISLFGLSQMIFRTW